MEYVYLPQTDSTNNELKRRLAAENIKGEDGKMGGGRRDDTVSDGTVIYTYFQSAGRGQQGNSWESEAGQNLLFSVLIRPEELQAAEQFRLSEWVAVALQETLQQYTDGITIKWPNDIYWHNKKLVGILIENTLGKTHIATSIIGIGINVNQTQFVSGAPNPVSLKQIIGKEVDKEELLHRFMHVLEAKRPLLLQPDELKKQYMQHLYRREGEHWFVERATTLAPAMIEQQRAKEAFQARIVDVESDGRLVLQTAQGEQKKYAFKQIRYIIESEDETRF